MKIYLLVLTLLSAFALLLWQGLNTTRLTCGGGFACGDGPQKIGLKADFLACGGGFVCGDGPHI